MLTVDSRFVSPPFLLRSIEMNILDLKSTLEPLSPSQREYICLRLMNNSNAEACRVVGIHPERPQQWRHNSTTFKTISNEVMKYKDVLGPDALDLALSDPELGIVLVTEDVAKLIPSRIDRLKMRSTVPLVVEIPKPGGPEPGQSTLAQIVQRAVGVKF